MQPIAAKANAHLTGSHGGKEAMLIYEKRGGIASELCLRRPSVDSMDVFWGACGQEPRSKAIDHILPTISAWRKGKQ